MPIDDLENRFNRLTQTQNISETPDNQLNVEESLDKYTNVYDNLKLALPNVDDDTLSNLVIHPSDTVSENMISAAVLNEALNQQKMLVSMYNADNIYKTIPTDAYDNYTVPGVGTVGVTKYKTDSVVKEKDDPYNFDKDDVNKLKEVIQYKNTKSDKNFSLSTYENTLKTKQEDWINNAITKDDRFKNQIEKKNDIIKKYGEDSFEYNNFVKETEPIINNLKKEYSTIFKQQTSTPVEKLSSQALSAFAPYTNKVTYVLNKNMLMDIDYMKQQSNYKTMGYDPDEHQKYLNYYINHETFGSNLVNGLEGFGYTSVIGLLDGLTLGTLPRSFIAPAFEDAVNMFSARGDSGYLNRFFVNSGYTSGMLIGNVITTTALMSFTGMVGGSAGATAMANNLNKLITLGKLTPVVGKTVAAETIATESAAIAKDIESVNMNIIMDASNVAAKTVAQPSINFLAKSTSDLKMVGSGLTNFEKDVLVVPKLIEAYANGKGKELATEIVLQGIKLSGEFGEARLQAYSQREKTTTELIDIQLEKYRSGKITYAEYENNVKSIKSIGEDLYTKDVVWNAVLLHLTNSLTFDLYVRKMFGKSIFKEVNQAYTVDIIKNTEKKGFNVIVKNNSELAFKQKLWNTIMSPQINPIHPLYISANVMESVQEVGQDVIDNVLDNEAKKMYSNYAANVKSGMVADLALSAALENPSIKSYFEDSKKMATNFKDYFTTEQAQSVFWNTYFTGMLTGGLGMPLAHIIKKVQGNNEELSDADKTKLQNGLTFLINNPTYSFRNMMNLKTGDMIFNDALVSKDFMEMKEKHENFEQSVALSLSKQNNEVVSDLMQKILKLDDKELTEMYDLDKTGYKSVKNFREDIERIFQRVDNFKQIREKIDKVIKSDDSFKQADISSNDYVYKVAKYMAAEDVKDRIALGYDKVLMLEDRIKKLEHSISDTYKSGSFPVSADFNIYNLLSLNGIDDAVKNATDNLFESSLVKNSPGLEKAVKEYNNILSKIHVISKKGLLENTDELVKELKEKENEILFIAKSVFKDNTLQDFYKKLNSYKLAKTFQSTLFINSITNNLRNSVFDDSKVAYLLAKSLLINDLSKEKITENDLDEDYHKLLKWSNTLTQPLHKDIAKKILKEFGTTDSDLDTFDELYKGDWIDISMLRSFGKTVLKQSSKDVSVINLNTNLGLLFDEPIVYTDRGEPKKGKLSDIFKDYNKDLLLSPLLNMLSTNPEIYDMITDIVDYHLLNNTYNFSKRTIQEFLSPVSKKAIVFLKKLQERHQSELSKAINKKDRKKVENKYRLLINKKTHQEFQKESFLNREATFDIEYLDIEDEIIREHLLLELANISSYMPQYTFTKSGNILDLITLVEQNKLDFDSLSKVIKKGNNNIDLKDAYIILNFINDILSQIITLREKDSLRKDLSSRTVISSVIKNAFDNVKKDIASSESNIEIDEKLNNILNLIVDKEINALSLSKDELIIRDLYANVINEKIADKLQEKEVISKTSVGDVYVKRLQDEFINDLKNFNPGHDAFDDLEPIVKEIKENIADISNVTLSTNIVLLNKKEHALYQAIIQSDSSDIGDINYAFLFNLNNPSSIVRDNNTIYLNTDLIKSKYTKVLSESDLSDNLHIYHYSDNIKDFDNFVNFLNYAKQEEQIKETINCK